MSVLEALGPNSAPGWSPPLPFSAECIEYHLLFLDAWKLEGHFEGHAVVGSRTLHSVFPGAIFVALGFDFYGVISSSRDL